ncbi:hypothetical protein [Nocardioides sp. BYT-33-1]|uniref:hypothetical protein n=1 Tax=Nocardioides sp. BYT-33-1 TaxID=3416952 RepID=UPI003F52C527
MGSNSAAGSPTTRTSSGRSIPAGALRTLGLVHRDTRELAEMSFQFTAPFVLDSRPTPFDAAMRATVGWWRARTDAGNAVSA